MRTSYDGPMKVFTCDNEEWVVAADPDDAAKVYHEQTGADPLTDTGHAEGDPIPWTECRPDKVFTLHEAAGDAKMTNAEFAATRGRCYLGSANY